MTGIYFHIPFCRSKCGYCDFYSVAPPDPALLARYPELLIRQLELTAPDWAGPVTTVFFGGGTPSLLPAAEVARLLAAVKAHLGLAPDAEISVEANPGTVDGAYLAALRRTGVNRLSLGLQALDDGALARLGRGHDTAQGLAAIAAARAAGFDNLSVDLIYGLPGEDLQSLTHSLERIVACSPEHLSCYALTVEEGTPFATAQESGTLQLPDEATVATHYRLIDQALTTAGYRHYEISNFARPRRECRHNLATWRRRAYLGLGAGAHSFRASGWGERRAVPADLARYAAQVAAGCEPSEPLERFDRRGAMAETLYLGLRTAEGVDEAAFRARFGDGVATAFPEAVRRSAARLSLHDDGRWRFDLDGWLLFDHLIVPFL
jgi:oxygen-independent coproporphyrinogen-3 oxidase